MSHPPSVWLWAVALCAALAAVWAVRQLCRPPARHGDEFQPSHLEHAATRAEADAGEPGRRELHGNRRHAVHTPLQDVLALLQRLDETPLSDPQRACVQAARASTLYALGVLNGTPVGAAAAPDRATPAPAEPNAGAAGLIDTASYAEVASMLTPDTMTELLGTLFEAPQGGVHVLVASLVAGDADQIEHDARKLKGTVTMLGFRALVRTAAQIERLAPEDNASLRQALSNQLLADMDRTQHALRQLASALSV